MKRQLSDLEYETRFGDRVRCSARVATVCNQTVRRNVDFLGPGGSTVSATTMTLLLRGLEAELMGVLAPPHHSTHEDERYERIVSLCCESAEMALTGDSPFTV